MKFSYEWISQLVGGLTLEPAQLESLITVRTAECEGIEPWGVHFMSAKVVRVLTSEPVGKGKNSLVTADAGGGNTVSLICGASNVRAGLLTVWVPPGTNLHGRTIGVAVIDGVESQGMLASAAELEISRDHAGVIELWQGEPGTPLENLKPDWIIEIDNKSLTHRPDLWGHLGMAREVAAIAGRPLQDPVQLQYLPAGEAPYRAEIADYALCPRYSAVLLQNLAIEPSPLALQARLQSIGMNPISNMVDITNFVLAELPQPMHAFDADKLSGTTIYVRLARTGERLRALNGETYDLHPADLVIADASGPIALAGVIGGADTAISAATKRVLFESANFAPTGVRLTSVRHKVRTDASMRFEKSLDPENTIRGLARALELLQQACPVAQPVGGITDNRGPARVADPILLPTAFVSRKLGKQMTTEGVAAILIALGFAAAETTPGILTVQVPTWRATKDISLKDDLVEEVGRMIGYETIPPQAPAVASVVPPANPMRVYFRQVRAQMAAQGFSDVYNYSFLSVEAAEQFGFKEPELLRVAKPIAAELTHMRPSLLPGIWKNIVNNVRHYREFRLFELGIEIHGTSDRAQLPDEVPHLAAVMYNSHGDERDLFELKRVLECVLPGALVRAAEARSYEHPARVAEIHWQGAAVGRFFELHPSLLESEGIEGRAMLFDLDLRATQAIAAAFVPKYVPPRKYPTSGFDLSVVTALKTPVADMQDRLAALGDGDLATIEFVRQYDGPPLPAGQKSVTFHLEIGSLQQTVTTEEVTAVRNRIIEGMRTNGFEFRE